MASCRPTNIAISAPLSRTQRRNRSIGLRDNRSNSFISPNDNPFRWLAPSSPAENASRQISLLAEFIGQVVDNPFEAATRLIEEFGTLKNVFSATDERLQATLEDFPKLTSLLVSSRAVHSFASAATRAGTPIDWADCNLHRYLIDEFKGLSKERLMVIFLDASSLFIRLEFVAFGEEDDVTLNPLKIISRAFDLSARRLILAHNHPSNIAEPSQVDIDATQGLSKLCERIGIILDDHFIVTNESAFSMRGAELI